MNVLIIGKNSKLGHSIIKEFKFKKENTVSTDSLHLDITSQKSLKFFFQKQHQFDFIINCAAYTNVSQAESNYDQAHLLNCQAVLNISNFAKHFNIPMIHISTDYVFDGNKETFYTEKDIPNPISNYGLTKLHGENILKENWSKHIILRVGWLFSSYGVNFLTKIFKKITQDSVVKVVNNQTGIPTSTKYLAHAIYCLCFSIQNNPNFADWGIYHAANKRKVSWFEFCKIIFDFMVFHGCLCKARIIECCSNDIIRPKNSALCSNKFYKTFCFNPEDWEGYLEREIKILSNLV